MIDIPSSVPCIWCQQNQNWNTFGLTAMSRHRNIIGILTSGVDSLGIVMYVAAPETIMNIKIPTNTLALDRAKSIIFI